MLRLHFHTQTPVFCFLLILCCVHTSFVNVSLTSSTAGRPGTATKTHSCGRVRQVPRELRDEGRMNLDEFYEKYTEAYGIPVVSSANTTNSALKRACYVLRFMLADNIEIREAFYRNYGRVGVISATEELTTIPEYSDLDPDYWNWRARGLGATKTSPVSTAGEENLMCSEADVRYPDQDLLVHELAHGVHLLGAVDAIEGWDSRLRKLYLRRQSGKQWEDTYSMSSYLEYFAEGTQAYFNVNSYSAVPNGREGPINTREKLQQYDPELFSLIRQVFPCGNELLGRCNATRRQELQHDIQMDCQVEEEEEEGTMEPTSLPPGCVDRDTDCDYWAREGYCEDGEHVEYMASSCNYSCSLCGAVQCEDEEENCSYWAQEDPGYCTDSLYSEYMGQKCRRSCSLCEGSCVDKGYNCGFLASVGECELSGAYMLEYCMNSCGACPG